MGYQFFTAQPTAAVSDALRAHYRGDTRPSTAESREGLEAVVDLLADRTRLPSQWRDRDHGPAAAAAITDRVQAIPRRGRPTANYRVDLLFAGPPPYESPDAWPQERIEQWERDSLQWLADGMPHAVVETAVRHQDERSVHLHVTVVPVDESGDRISWARTRPGLAGESYDRRRNHVLLMKATHDRYHAAVGRHYGLERDRGAARVPRESAIDRNQGELLRAADGGYSEAYLANARAEVQWAASAGPQLRAEIDERESETDDRFDREVEFLERYRLKFGGLDRAIRDRSEGTVSLGHHDLAVQVADVKTQWAEVKQAKVLAGRRYARIANRERALDDGLSELARVITDTTVLKREIGERGAHVGDTWRSFLAWAVDALPEQVVIDRLLPVSKALQGLWAESRLAKLVERFVDLQDLLRHRDPELEPDRRERESDTHPWRNF